MVNVKYGYTSVDRWQMRFDIGRGDPALGDPRIPLPHARDRRDPHRVQAPPVPDTAGQAGAAQIATLLSGLTPGVVYSLVLISGGGSALLPLPVEGVTLAEYQTLTTALLRCGAGHHRDQHHPQTLLSAPRRAIGSPAAPAQCAAPILSDVVGTPLEALASGPTVPDRSTFADAMAM